MPETTGQKAYLWFAVVWTAVSYAIFASNREFLRPWVREDGFYEWATAAFFLTAGVLCLSMFLRSRNPDRPFPLGSKRNGFHALLGLFFILCFLEEVSWGQRIFGWQTPDVLMDWNKQKEANLHNLWILARENADGTRKEGIGSLLTASRMFSLFWLSFCVALPLANRFVPKVGQLVGFWRVPIVPSWVGALFVANYLGAKLCQSLLDDEGVHQVTEVKCPGIPARGHGAVWRATPTALNSPSAERIHQTS